MSETGIDLTPKPTTGIETEHIRMQLQFQSETNKMHADFKEKFIDRIFSAHFFVFIITLSVVICGIIFMQKAVDVESIISFWQVILPLITTYIGYAIGHGKSKSN